MQRASRLKFVILATIACAILFCIAAFSVSFAMWTFNGNAAAEIDGNVGLFYVEYPRYEGDYEDLPAPPDLKAGTYYLQVPKADNSMQSDYYAMSPNVADNKPYEMVIKHLHLRGSDEVSLFNGTSRIEEFCRGGWSHSQFNSVDGGIMSFTDDGYYDFYYDTNSPDKPMHVEYSATFPSVETSAYGITFAVEFNNGGVKTTRTMCFKKPNDSYAPHIYIWDDATPKWYYSSQGYETTDGAGVGVTNIRGNPRSMSDAAGKTIVVGSFDNTMVIFNNGTNWNSDQSKDTKLADLATEAVNYIDLKTGSQNTPTRVETAASAALSGPTDFKKPSGSTTLLPDKTVRAVKKTDETNATYHNYVCVKRINTEATLAYVNFSFGDVSSASARITSISVARRLTDENGNPSASTVEMQVYNQPSSGTDGYPLIKDVKYDSAKNDNTNPYVILDFAGGTERYYAMDVTVTTDSVVNYELRADASNKDRHVFEVANSFYLGFDEWTMREPVFMGEIPADKPLPDKDKETTHEYDISVETTLGKGDSFKLFASDDSGKEKNKYFGVGRHDGNVYKHNITVYDVNGSRIDDATVNNMFTLPTQTYGSGVSDIAVKTAGKYRLRYHGKIKWEHAESGITTYTFEYLDINVLEPITINNTIIVTFNACDGSFADGKTEITQTVKKGGKAVKPANPVSDVDNLVFKGWYNDETCTDGPFDFDTPINETKVLYAKYGEKTSYIVTFKNFDGSVVCKLETDENGTLLGQTLPTATRDGDWTFVCWRTGTADAMTVNGDQISTTYNFTTDTYVWADWTAIARYKVTYSLGDMPGTLSKTEESILDGGTIATAPTATTLIGHSIVGWYTLSGSTEKAFTFGTGTSATKITGETTIYAKLSGAAYSIDGGTPVAMTKDTTATTETVYNSVIDTRTNAAAVANKPIKIYFNGVALASIDEDSSRVTLNEQNKTFTLGYGANTDKIKGKFTVKAHGTAAASATVDIKFIGGNAAAENAESTANGYYVVGQFSAWSTYNANKLNATNVEGILSTTLDFVITDSGKADEYKIVHRDGGSTTWYTTAGATDGDNMSATSTTFHVDEFKKGTSGMYPNNLNFRRVLFSQYDNISNNSMSSKRPKIKINSGTESNMTEIRKDSATSSTVFYYDVSTTTLSNIEIRFTSPHSTNNTWTSGSIAGSKFTNGYSYMIEPDYLGRWDWWDLTWSPTVKRYNGTSYATTV